MTKQPPTIERMKKELDAIWYSENKEEPTPGWEFAYHEKELNAEHLGDVKRLVSKTESFFRSYLEEMLEWLEMEETELAQNEKGSYGDGYNQAIDKLNQKIKQLKEQWN